MAAILLADDEVKLGAVLAEALALAGHSVTRVTGGRAALVELSSKPFDVVVTDLRMPEVDGLTVLAEARRLPAPPAVLVMTAFGSTESAVDAMKAGAADYLTKPFALDEFRMRVSRAAEAQASAQREHRLLGELTPALVAQSARAVKEGRFREDFFYRLDVFSITVPPLRERRDDVLPLAEAWLLRRGLPADKLGAGGRQALLARQWPGNVRELENALERAVILAGEGELTEAWLAEPSRSHPRDDVGGLLGEGFDLDEFELRLLRAALERTGDNKAAAARLLGITRRRLYSRLETLSKSAPDEGS